MSDTFVGEIKIVGFNFAPVGYAFANGATIQIQQQQALYSLIGTIYGGNAQTTFQLPNLQSRVGVGFATYGATVPPNTTQYPIGNAGGQQVQVLTTSQMPMHTHTISSTVNSTLAASTAINALAAPSARLPGPSGNLLTGATDSSGTPINGYAAPGTGNPVTMAAGAATTTLTGGVSVNATAGTAGSSQAVDMRMPYIALNYIIALVGIYPQRN